MGAPIGVVKVALQDSNGKTVTTANDTVTSTLDSNPAMGVLSGTTNVRAVGGVATFAALAIGQPSRGYTLRASIGKLSTVSSAAFDIGNQIATPVITPPTGSFSGPVWVGISNSVPGTTIRFTSDGKDPEATSPIYTGPFQITGSRLIKAIAQSNGLTDSAVASASIDITGSTPYGLDYRPPVSGVRIPAAADSLPAALSGTGIFSDNHLTAKTGVVHYSLNSSVWADGAQIKHWVALPDSAKIGFAPAGEYQWPGGTVFVQHFEIVTDQTTGARRRLETRLLVLDPSGTFG